MIVGYLDRPASYTNLLVNDDWRLAFRWAIAAREQPPEDGEYPLRGHEVRATVKTVQTTERGQGVFEAHRREVDIHVCLDGSEVIEVAPLFTLRARGKYDAEKDSTLYDVPGSKKSVEMTPGAFAVFFPEDGHMPGVKFQHPQVRKIVFKLPYVEAQ